jgi:hypothetical protein
MMGRGEYLEGEHVFRGGNEGIVFTGVVFVITRCFGCMVGRVVDVVVGAGGVLVVVVVAVGVGVEVGVGVFVELVGVFEMDMDVGFVVPHTESFFFLFGFSSVVF